MPIKLAIPRQKKEASRDATLNKFYEAQVLREMILKRRKVSQHVEGFFRIKIQRPNSAVVKNRKRKIDNNVMELTVDEDAEASALLHFLTSRAGTKINSPKDS